MTNFVSGAQLFASQLNAAFAQVQPFPATTPPYGSSGTSVATTAYVNAALNAFFPENYGAVTGTVSGAQRLANTAAINACVTAATAAGGFVKFGPFTYQIDGTISVPPAANDKGTYLRGESVVTRIEQWHSAGGIDTIHYGPPTGTGGTIYGGGIDGLWIVSMVDQSNTAPLAGHLGGQLAISAAFFCSFTNITIGEYNSAILGTNHYAYYGLITDQTPSNCFNCNYQNIEIKGYGQSAWFEQTTSGSVHANIMMVNGGLGDANQKTSNGPAMVLANCQGTFDQINIEWSTFGNFNNCALSIQASQGVKFGHLHLEGVQLSQPGGQPRVGFIFCQGEGDCSFDSINLITMNAPTANLVTSLGLFTFGFFAPYCSVSVGQLCIQGTTLGAGVNFYLVNTTNTPTVNNCVLDFNGPFIFFADGPFSAKITNWSDVQFVTNTQGPANGLGVPPTNLTGRAILSITTSAYGYSAGTFTASMLDGNDTYIWNAGVNGTVVLPLTVMDALLPITAPPYPGQERTIINPTGGANTVAVHDSATTNLLAAVNLTAGKFVRLRFDGANWKQINAGSLA